MSKYIFGIFICLMSLNIGCKKAGSKDLKNKFLEFAVKVIKLNEGETYQLQLLANNEEYDLLENSLNVRYSVENPEILKVNEKGIVEAINPGVTIVYAETNKQKIEIEVTVFNSNLTNKIKQPLRSENIFSKGVYLVRNTVIQSIDIDSEGSVFYDQLGGQLKHVIFVGKGKPNKDLESSMQLKYFGHGTNLAVEEQGEDRFIWINSNGHKKNDGEYGSNKTFSRIKYEPGKIVERYEEGDTYYLADKLNIHPAIDQKNDVLAITTSGGGDPARYFYIYKLSEALALKEKPIRLPELRFGGEEQNVGGPPETIVEPIVQVKDLGDLNSIASFKVQPSNDYTKLNSYDFQGFDVEDGKLYFFEGEGNGNDIANGPSNAFVTVFDYMNGKEISERAKVGGIASILDLDNFGITQTGYMEAEGIKMKDGVLYLGFASRSYDEKRRANIFIYK